MPASNAKRKLLISEGKSFLSNIIQETFQNDYNCTCVSTVGDTIRAIRDADIAIVSLNINPDSDIDNYEIIVSLKKIKDIPILVMTNQYSSKVRINLLKCGADDVVTKPFNPEELYLRIRNLTK